MAKDNDASCEGMAFNDAVALLQEFLRCRAMLASDRVVVWLAIFKGIGVVTARTIPERLEVQGARPALP